MPKTADTLLLSVGLLAYCVLLCEPNNPWGQGKSYHKQEGAKYGALSTPIGD